MISDFFLETFFISASPHTKPTSGNPIFLAVSKGELCLCYELVTEPKSPSLELKVRQLEEISPGLPIQRSGNLKAKLEYLSFSKNIPLLSFLPSQSTSLLTMFLS